MKKFLVCGCLLIGLLMSSTGLQAQEPQNLPTELTGVWHLAAAGFSTRLAETVNPIPSDWRSYQPITVMLGWLLVESAQPVERGGLGMLYNQAVLNEFLKKFVYFAFGQSADLKVAPQFLPPLDPNVTGSMISCLNNEQDIIRVFRYTAEEGFMLVETQGVPNADRLEFVNIPVGRYVLGYPNNLNRLPTTFLDVR